MIWIKHRNALRFNVGKGGLIVKHVLPTRFLMKMFDGIVAALLYITRPQMVHMLISISWRTLRPQGRAIMETPILSIRMHLDR